MLLPVVDHAEVCGAVGTCPAGVFGYGNRCFLKGAPAWHGTKAVNMTRDWCEVISIILENTHLHQFEHGDMRLKDLVRLGKAEGCELPTALGGCAHRISLTTPSDGRPCWGGAVLPD